jgi:hypothetical protein
MVSGYRAVIQILYLIAMVVLAVMTLAVGPVYTFVLSILSVLWRLVHKMFMGFSRVVGLASSTFLTHVLTDKGFPFGGGYTISAVLGRNQFDKRLTSVGVWLANTLDTIDEEHCEKAAIKAGLL